MAMPPDGTLNSEPPLASLLSVVLAVISTPFVAGAVAFVLLLFASAVVSGAEVAIFSLTAADRETLSGRHDHASRRVCTLLEKPQHTMITILVLNTLINVSAAILAALATERVVTHLALAREVVFLLEIVALTFVLLVVSEITPKLFASRHAMAYSRAVALPLRVASFLLYPIAAALGAWTQRTQEGFWSRVLPEDSKKISPAEVSAMADIGKEQGSVGEDEHLWINSILRFSKTSVRTVMVNRLDIAALSIGASLPEALALIRSTGHSRLPLYVGHLDKILGIVYAKDLLPYLAPDKDHIQIDWTRLMRPPMFVPQSKKLDALLQDFQQAKTHLAIVVDEYGGTAGLVTLEDILEEVVGDIQDEHDSTKKSLVEPLGDNRYRIDARIDLDDLNTILGIALSTERFNFETLGGLIFHLAGDIPAEGDEITYEPLHMVVDSVVNNRIGLVRVHVAGLAKEDDS